MLDYSEEFEREIRDWHHIILKMKPAEVNIYLFTLECQQENFWKRNIIQENNIYLYTPSALLQQRLSKVNRI